MEREQHRFVIVGGGTAGIVLAAHLRNAGLADIAIIEPSATHFYQPIWTLVGAGCVRKEFSARSEARYIPQGATWIRDAVEDIAPDQRYVMTRGGKRVDYEFLAVAPGIQLNWDGIPGLKEAIGRDNVSSNYGFDLAPRTWEMIRNFRGGTALFHMPGTPIKCPGAPQKIMYLAADHFRRTGIAKSAHVIYGSGPGAIYGIQPYAGVLDQVVERYGIDARYNHHLVEIHSEKNEAVFEVRKGEETSRTVIPYDILHVIPPQSAPDFLKNSPLADPASPLGWIKVDKYTLQNPDYPNVFSLGDAGNSPNSKTAASACRQAPVVARNIASLARGKEPESYYDGYVACPIVTGYGRMLLCEFDYTGKPTPLIPLIDTMKERYDMWLLKRHGLPWMYWHVMLKGRTVPFLYSKKEPVVERPITTKPAAA